MRYSEIQHQDVTQIVCKQIISPTCSNKAETEILDIAYKVFRSCKLTANQQDFSVNILGKAPSYLSCMRARGRSPDISIFYRLLENTKLFRDGIELNQHFGNEYAENLNTAHRRLQALVNTLEEELERRSKIFGEK